MVLPRLAPLLAALVLLGAAAAAPASPVVDGSFPLPDTPRQIALGPDGAMWVTLDGAVNKLARVAGDGTVSLFSPTAVTSPVGVAAGPDGNLWLTQPNEVVRLSPSDPAAAVAFGIAALADPRGITAGPDGNVWTASGDRVVRIPPAAPATFTEFTVAGMGARGIAAGSDGRLWVADFGGQRIVSVSTAGTATAHAVGGGPQEVAAGPAGQVAYSNPGTMPQTLGRLAEGGLPETTPVGTSDPFGITFATDGAYWTARFASGDLGRLTPDGAFSTLIGLGAAAGPRYLAAGPGNTLWVTLETQKAVTRISGVDPPPPPADPPPPGAESPETTTPVDDPVATLDRTAPVLTGLRLSAARFRVGSVRASRPGRPARGTIIRFTLSEPAAVRIRVDRVLAGRRSGGRCVAPRRSLRRARPCRRHRRVATLRRSARAHANAVRYGGRGLRPGPHRLVVVATDAAGNVAPAQRRRFRVIRPR